MYEETEGAYVSGSAAAAAEPEPEDIIPEYCPDPIVHTIHPEPVTVPAATLEDNLESVTLEPVFVPPNSEIPEAEASIPPAREG
ncbi:MAG: hypothetical protein ACKPKO_51460, partial [Candidatus Fonsibacter sp.]